MKFAKSFLHALVHVMTIFGTMAIFALAIGAFAAGSVGWGSAACVAAVIFLCLGLVWLGQPEHEFW